MATACAGDDDIQELLDLSEEPEVLEVDDDAVGAQGGGPSAAAVPGANQVKVKIGVEGSGPIQIKVKREPGVEDLDDAAASDKRQRTDGMGESLFSSPPAWIARADGLIRSRAVSCLMAAAACDPLFPRVLPHLCSWLPREDYLYMASRSRACSQHALAPLKHQAFLAVVKAQRASRGVSFPLTRLAEALAPLLPPGVSGLSHRALLYLRGAMRLQAIAAWRAAGQLLLARVGDRLKARDEAAEWPVEASVWSSRITTGDVRMALTIADHWGAGGPSRVAHAPVGVVLGDPWWESLMKGLAREAGVVDFDNGALYLLLEEWERGLRAAAGGTRRPDLADLGPVVEVEKDEGPYWKSDDEFTQSGGGWRGPPQEREPETTIWASDLRMALLLPNLHLPWPVLAGVYSPPNPPWPEVNSMVGDMTGSLRRLFGDYHHNLPSVPVMQLATQVGVGVRGD
jgi:hypothetical protein